MKIKIAYIINGDISSVSSGVGKKIRDQEEIWRKLGNNVQLFYIGNESVEPSFLPANLYKKNIYEHLSSYNALIHDLSSFKPDIVYIRFPLLMPFLVRILRNYRVVLELNSLDVEERKLLRLKSVKKFAYFYYNLFTRGLLHQYAAGFVAVTNEIANHPSNMNWGKTNAVIPNSIICSRFKILKRLHANMDSIGIAFLGSPNQPWHGLDKIERLARNLGDAFHFHIIGTENGAACRNVTCYGPQDQNEYEKILQNCDIAISTMALHRKQMNEACPLKTREYLAYGYPVIAGYADTAWLGAPPAWILQIPNTEDNLDNPENISSIKNFCLNMKNYIVPRKESGKYIDSNIIEEKRIRFLREIALEDNVAYKST